MIDEKDQAEQTRITIEVEDQLDDVFLDIRLGMSSNVKDFLKGLHERGLVVSRAESVKSGEVTSLGLMPQLWGVNDA